MFSKLRLYLYSAIGLLVAGLAVAVKVLTARNSRLSRKLDTADARNKHTIAVMRADKEADEQADLRLVETTKEVNDKGHSDELSDPNDTW